MASGEPAQLRTAYRLHGCAMICVKVRVPVSGKAMLKVGNALKVVSM
jgi:hypothetical protein